MNEMRMEQDGWEIKGRKRREEMIGMGMRRMNINMCIQVPTSIEWLEEDCKGGGGRRGEKKNRRDGRGYWEGREG